MCYEVHGYAGKYFNLVSDRCLSVNAFFSELPGSSKINRMSEIGVLTRNNENECVRIKVDVNGCIGSLVGRGNITSVYRDKGINIGPYRNRWRVSVPNCGMTQVVLYIFCDSTDMLRFHIARGNNLASTSHGLLGESSSPCLKTAPVISTIYHFSSSILEYSNRPCGDR